MRGGEGRILLSSVGDGTASDWLWAVGACHLKQTNWKKRKGKTKK